MRPCLVFLLALFGGLAVAEPIPTELVQREDGSWQLLRDGQPYFIQGGGGDGDKALLAASGGNSFRTWGVDDDLEELLDEAQDLGLTVTVGHWLGHERHGFDYDDEEALAKQKEDVREATIRYRGHPALLMWAVGNEMEGYEDGDDPRIWKHVNELAAMIKELDPYHPVMTVTAELGGNRIAAIKEHCPDVDIHGVNSYGGLPSVPQRYVEQGGEKPIIITEFGPPGTWEVGRTSFGAPPELSSTQKAEVYREAYTKGCLVAPELCLGGYAFTWGFKMEATSTWFGMLLPTGDKLAAVDVMHEIWTGAPPADKCPEITRLEIVGSDSVKPGDTVEIELDVMDPEGAEVRVEWEIRGEASTYVTGGDQQATPFALEDVIVASSNEGATLKMPGGGVYRLYVRAFDGTGGAANANVPLFVDGPKQSARVKMPVVVYGDKHIGPWSPSGWMGGGYDLKMDMASKVQPRSGETCLEFRYEGMGYWVGVVWQHPENDWGELPGGFDLTGATKLTFWARSEHGGEKVDFGVGILGSDVDHPDSAQARKEGVKLSKEWKQYEIELKDADLTQIKSGFMWSLGGRDRPIIFYLDDIQFE